MTSNRNIQFVDVLWQVKYSPTSVPTLACSIATSIACSMTRRSGVRTCATSDSNSKSARASFMLLRLWDMYNFSICTVWNNKTHYNVIFALSSNSGQQGPEPCFGVSRQNIRKKMKRWMRNQHLAMWRGPCSAQRQARELISGHMGPTTVL